ncbi:MAG: TolC family protein [Proteobacteria bacterium]|nr:TolC family protein [Pseudomonadota bacterium]MBU1737770.1 TolC family protein [Pseudomonadota bacterium]
MKTWSKITLVLLLLAVTPGITIASGQKPEDSAPQVWTARKAVYYALRNNPDSGMARQRLKAAQSMVTMEKSSLYPQLAFSSRYSQTDNPMYSFGNILNQGAFNSTIDFNNPGRTDDLNMGVRVNYRLYNGGRDLAGIEGAEAHEEAAEKELGAIRDELAFGAIRTFNLIIQAEGIVKAHQTALEAINTSLAVAQARYNEGVLLRADVLNLEVQQSRSEENLIQAQNSLEEARKVFLNLMGLKEGVVQIFPDITEEQEIPSGRTAENRFELQAAEAMVRAAEARLKQAQGGRLPTVEGFAGYDFDHGTVTDHDGDSWLAGVQLSYTLFDGRRTSAAVAAAAASLAEAKERLRKTELAIELEIRRAELAVHDAETRLAVTEKGVEQAKESARIYRARFREGEVLASDLVTAENGLTEALLRKTVAGSAHNIAIAGLRKALGLEQFPDLDKENPAGKGS